MNQHAIPANGATDDVAARERRAVEALMRLAVSLVHSGSRDIGLTGTLTLVSLYWNGPQRLTDLAKSQGVSQPSMSGLVASLERVGMVARRHDAADRRVVLVSIIDAGIEYLERRREAAVEVLMRRIGALPEEDRATLLAAAPVLDRILG